MTNLDGKVVALMGAGSITPGWSNGKAAAVAYSRAGATVLCVDWDIDRAEETVSVIESEGGKALALRADATREADVQAIVDEAVAQFGRLDVMHNNVGVGGSYGTPEDITPETWDRELAQNLTSAYLGIRCVVPVMRKQGGGVITNTSSVLAVRFLRSPNVAYTAAKAAVEAMTRTCAAAYGRDNIRVNCIRIGFAETPLLQLGVDMRDLPADQAEAELAKSRRKVPLRGEHTDPFDIAGAAVFLASDDARGVTGVVLGVDGGLECAPI